MSVQEAPTVNGQDVIADEAHDGDPPIETGGSQLTDDVSAVGDDGERTEEPEAAPSQTDAEGDKPEAKEAEERPATAVSDEVAELRAEVEQARRMRDDVLAIAKANPAVAKAFGLATADAEGGSKDVRSRIDAAIDESFAPADGKALKGALAPLFEELADLRRQVGRADSTAGRVAQTQAQRDFRAALVDAKVPVDNPAFVKIQKDLRRDPDFAQAEAEGKKWASRAAIDAWFASAGRKAVAGDDRARIQAAKSGRVGGRPAGNAATAEKTIRIDGPYDASVALRHRMAAMKAGKPEPRFEWHKDT